MDRRPFDYPHDFIARTEEVTGESRDDSQTNSLVTESSFPWIV